MLDVFVPAAGMAPDDVTLTSWCKSPGDAVAAGEPVAMVETSKAELEIVADTDGVLGRALFPAGARVAPGTTIARILQDGEHEAPTETATELAPTDPAASPVDAAPPSIGEATATAASEVSSSRPRHSVSPRQRRIAAERAADAQAQAGARSPAPAPVPSPTDPGIDHSADDADDPDDRFRRAIGAAVERSWREIPHFTVTRDLVVDDVVEAVARWRTVVPQLTLTDALVRGLALAMMDRERTSNIDLGLAVATERGVAIPVLRDVLTLGLVELVDARRAAVDRARARRLVEDDARTPVTTLSNLGVLGVDQFTGVVPFGQTSLLTVGRAAQRPVVVDGQLAVATTMTVTANVDHRSWDGAHAAQLLARLAAVLSAPDTLLVPTGLPRETS